MIVEDDDKIASIVSGWLTNYGYQTCRATDYRNLKAEFISNAPDLVLLDINLPYMDGFYWCRQFRTLSKAPVIFVSARTGEMDQVFALESGGDNYVTKPFSMDVLVAKVRAALRRAYGEYSPSVAEEYDPDVYELDNLYIYRSRNAVEFRGREIYLAPKELRLLDILARKPGQIVDRSQLLEALWDDVEFVDDNTLTVNVSRVKRKLSEIGIHDVIETVRGQGYRLNPVWRDLP